jgi:glucosylceramidase
VHVWLTTPDLLNKLTRQADIMPTGSGTANVTFNESDRRQTLDGFGAAFTDTSVWLIQTQLSAANRDKVMSDLFSRPSGIGLSFMRLPMGSSDFTQCSCTYSYDDGAADPTLSRFSTERDDAYIIPVLKQAQTINPQMKLFANPWSAPSWMKTNNSMLGVNGGALRGDVFEPFAQYFVRFLQEYKAKGVAVWGITPQNEPTNQPPSYSAMLFSANDETQWIANNLVPALRAGGLIDVKILGGDDTGVNPQYASTLFANATTANALYATAWHCYVGDLTAMTAIHNAHPDKPLYMTECSTGPTGIAGDATERTLVSTNNWASGVVLWNLALDQNGGPKMGVGCEGCTGLVSIDSQTGQYSYTINFYELGQFSKFVAPGAQRLAHTDGAGIWAQAYRNPDGTIAVVAYNRGSSALTFTVAWKRQGLFSYTAPAGATVTFTDVPAP